MKHYLKQLEETIREHWDQKALCDYQSESFTYADVAKHIEMFRLFLNEAGMAVWQFPFLLTSTLTVCRP